MRGRVLGAYWMCVVALVVTVLVIVLGYEVTGIRDNRLWTVLPHIVSAWISYSVGVSLSHFFAASAVMLVAVASVLTLSAEQPVVRSGRVAVWVLSVSVTVVNLYLLLLPAGATVY